MRRSGVARGDVVMALVIMLVAVGLVAVWASKAREARNEAETFNNMKTLALAVHQYHDTYRRLPDAFNRGGLYAEKPVSFWFHLLPYVEADGVYKSGKIDAIVPAFMAPTDPSQSNVAGTISFATNIRVIAFGSITWDKPNSLNKSVEIPKGKLVANITIPHIADGSYNTIMLTTRYSDCNGQKTWYATDPYGLSSLGEMPSAGVGGFMGAGSATTVPTPEGPLSAMYQLAPSRQQCLPDVAVFGHSFSSKYLLTALFDGSTKKILPGMAPAVFAKALCPEDDYRPFNANDE